jgi:hypothetical protein
MADFIFEIRFPDVEVSESRNRIDSSGSVRNEQREKQGAGISFLAQTVPDRDHPSHQNSRPNKKKI